MIMGVRGMMKPGILNNSQQPLMGQWRFFSTSDAHPLDRFFEVFSNTNSSHQYQTPAVIKCQNSKHIGFTNVVLTTNINPSVPCCGV